MKRIFKYPILPVTYPELELPLNAEILTFQSQKGSFYIWAIIEEGLSIEKRYFRLAGTGHDLTEDSPKIKKYIGTAQIADGGLVFHLFEIWGIEYYRGGKT